MEEEARQAKLASGQAGISSREREKIQQIVEQVIVVSSRVVQTGAKLVLQGAELENVPEMDETAVKRILLGFEKKVSRNQEMRIKFPDQPDKFMVSEMELHDVVRELQNVSTVPHLYPIMVELNCVSTLLGLLALLAAPCLWAANPPRKLERKVEDVAI